ncbi:MAG: hypothetical protein IT372_18175 [Polyangiaceae bacterium]|nr:hypothetical protein [Polyangiaceae bacterium]
MKLPWAHLTAESIQQGDLVIDVLDGDECRGRLTREMLFDHTIEIVARARGWQEPADMAKIRESYKFEPMMTANLIFVVRRQDQVSGILSVKFLSCDGEPIIHLSNGSLLPGRQGSGVMTPVGLSAISRYNARLAPEGKTCRYLTGITQSPVVYGLLSTHGTMYPRLSSEPAPEPIKKMARYIAREFNPGLPFDEDRFILRNECQFFYKVVPRWRDPKVNEFFDSSLRYYEGDVFVVVLRLGA